MARAGAIVAAAIAIVSSFAPSHDSPTRRSRVVVRGVERAPSPAATLPPSAASQAAPSLAGTSPCSALSARPPPSPRLVPSVRQSQPTRRRCLRALGTAARRPSAGPRARERSLAAAAAAAKLLASTWLGPAPSWPPPSPPFRLSTYRLTTRPPTRRSRVVVCGVERAPSPAAKLPLAEPRGHVAPLGALGTASAVASTHTCS